jgi:hypothetical protein
MFSVQLFSDVGGKFTITNDVNHTLDSLSFILGSGMVTLPFDPSQHGLWPLYENLWQTAYDAFVFGCQKG